MAKSLSPLSKYSTESLQEDITRIKYASKSLNQKKKKGSKFRYVHVRAEVSVSLQYLDNLVP